MVRSPAATAAASRRATGRRLFLIRCTTQVCTTVAGKAARMASSNPASPSQQAIRMSRTPRLRRSAVTLAQNRPDSPAVAPSRSEEHTSELQSQSNLVCRLLLEKKKKKPKNTADDKKKSENKKT